MVVQWLCQENIHDKVIDWVGHQVLVYQKHNRKRDVGHCESNDPFVHATRDNQNPVECWKLYCLVALVTMKTSVKYLMSSAVQL